MNKLEEHEIEELRREKNNNKADIETNNNLIIEMLKSGVGAEIKADIDKLSQKKKPTFWDRILNMLS